MTQKECLDLFAAHSIRPTANRIIVAKTLASAERPLTLSELEDRLLSIDKSSIFRTLSLFREHHLIHDIEDGGNGLRYELCLSHSKDEDDDLHVHFFCQECHRTYCLEDVSIPTVTVPDGYLVASANHIVKGICPNCRKDR